VLHEATDQVISDQMKQQFFVHHLRRTAARFLGLPKFLK
jgi:hypothetical protein